FGCPSQGRVLAHGFEAWVGVVKGGKFMTSQSCAPAKGRQPFILIGILILISQAWALMAQTGGGATLVGTVKDSSGSVVAGAKIRVVNTETSFLTETTTQSDGGYYVPYLT